MCATHSFCLVLKPGKNSCRCAPAADGALGESVLFPQVSATFAASLVSSPAIGAYLSASYGDSLVVLVATVVALLDICFILLAVPESFPEKMRPLSWGVQISWKQADPFVVNKNMKTFAFLSIFLSHANQRTFLQPQASQQLLIHFFLQ